MADPVSSTERKYKILRGLAIAVVIVMVLMSLVFLIRTILLTRGFPSAVDVVQNSASQPKSKTRPPAATPPPTAESHPASPEPTASPQVQPTLVDSAPSAGTPSDLASLTQQFAGGFFNLERASQADLDRNVELADQISRVDPDQYFPFKGKLISLLLKELKYNEDIDPAAYEDLYAELGRFRGPTERDQILDEIRVLQQESGDTIDTDVATAIATAESGAAELAGTDTDLVQIPFLRMKAMGDFDGLADMAEEYIEAYPNSYLGYVYLAEATWAAGEQAQAVDLFQRAIGPQISDAAAYEILKQMTSKSPIERIAEMGLD
ncbi:MAG: hypothetical protein NDI61_13790 [Bdellovibrionaceae bacterium]|nr:hypothetical protein [Pseudobdellovibrionaceae bacterium]